MSNEQERLQILEMIANGQISAAQGIELLNSLEGENEDIEPGKVVEAEELPLTPESAPSGDFELPNKEHFYGEQKHEVKVDPATTFANEPEVIMMPANNFGRESEIPEGVRRWRRWWWIPLWIGVGVTVFGGLVMFWVLQSTGLSFWFACSWLPFMIGLSIIVLGWASRTMRWLHIRIRQSPGQRPQNFAISLPLPLGLAAWLVRTLRPWMPENLVNLDVALLSIKDTSPEVPFYVEVDEGEGGDRVEVYIG